jgi:hypothetical protein
VPPGWGKAPCPARWGQGKARTDIAYSANPSRAMLSGVRGALKPARKRTFCDVRTLGALDPAASTAAPAALPNEWRRVTLCPGRRQ